MQQFPARIWVPRAKQIRDEIEQLSKEPPPSKSSKSDEEPATAIQVGDIEEEARHFRTPSVQRHVSSRMDPTEKHNRIIEAIYQASGRDLPEEYKTKGGAANVHGIRSREMKAPLEVIKEADETAATQRTLTELPDKKPVKSVESKKSDGEMVEDKTMSAEEPKKDAKKKAKEAEEKKSLETAVEAKKDEEKKTEKGKEAEKKEEKKEDDKKEDEKKEEDKKEEEKKPISSKEQIVTMEEIKEDQKKVEEKKDEGPTPGERNEKTEDKSEKSEKTDEASTSTKATAREEPPKKDDTK